MVANIYRRFKTCAGGADGGVVGLNGSIRATCLFHLLRALDICGREVLDFGAGDGRVLLAAMAVGASKASGYELPENKAHRFVFDAVRKTLADSETDASPSASRVAWSRADWLARDINVLRELPGRPSSVFTFWVGMPLPTQEHILALCARSPSIDAIAVFRDNKWRKPEEGVCSSHCSPCTQSHAALNLPFKLITFPSSPSPIALSFVVSKTTVSNIVPYYIFFFKSVPDGPPTHLPLPSHPPPPPPHLPASHGGPRRSLIVPRRRLRGAPHVLEPGRAGLYGHVRLRRAPRGLGLPQGLPPPSFPTLSHPAVFGVAGKRAQGLAAFPANKVSSV